MDKEEQVEVEIVSDDNYEESLTATESGDLEEVYRDKRTGNIVTHPKLRSKGGFAADPGRDICWNLYLKSWRAGAPNAKQAALEAGYSPNTAINIRSVPWFKERHKKLRKSKMMDNAERNIARILNLGYTKIKQLEDGSQTEEVDKDVLRVVADMSKTIVQLLGKDEGYSQRTEVKVSALPTPILELGALDITPKLEESNEPTVE